MKTNRGTTPFPNVILDVFMRKLKDTEFRVLCVVVRATLGYQLKTGQRKGEDWLSHSQLKARTGRHSEAVSKAIRSLVERDLVVVRGADGELLHEAAARMNHRSRLYFSLSSGLLALIETLSISEVRKSKVTKANQTKEKLINRKLRTSPSRGGGWQRAGKVTPP